MGNRQRRKKRLSKTIKKRTQSPRRVMWTNFWNIKTKKMKGGNVMKRRLRKKLFTEIVVIYENGDCLKVKKQPRRIQRAVFRTLLNNINYPNRYAWERKLKERLWGALA